MKYSLNEIHKMHTDAAGRNDVKTLKKCESLYDQILNQEPDNWTTLFLLAGIYLYFGRNGVAIALLNRVTQLKPACAEAWNNLGTAYQRQFHSIKAAAALKKCVELKPQDSDAWNNLGTLHINEGSAIRGIPHFERAIKLNPDNIHAHWNHALALLECGDYERGFQEYAWGLRSSDRLHRTYGAPDWDGERVGTLVVYGEQGIGDEIMFASMIEEAKARCDRLIFDCHPRLKALFERSFGIECHGTRKEKITPWAAGTVIDASCPIGGLGEFFRRSIDDFPREAYLTPKASLVDAMLDRLVALPTGINVGIGWRGGKHKTRTEKRSMGLDDMLPILQTKGVNFISLQYTPEAKAEIDDFMKANPDITIHHWPEIIQADDYDATAALVYALDLVISVNTSAVHLSGAMGAECWTLTPVRKAWRYYSPDGKAMSWYGSVRLFQQEIDGEWTPVIERVAVELGYRANPVAAVAVGA